MEIIPRIIGLEYVNLSITLSLAEKFLIYGFDISKKNGKLKKIDVN